MSPLKPDQKFYLLQKHLIPRLIYPLQNPGISLKTLQHIDLKIRTFVKTTLKLPIHTPNSYFYAKSKYGGLSISCFRHLIPSVYCNRLTKARHFGDSAARGILSNDDISKLTTRLTRMLHPCKPDSQSIEQYWAAQHRETKTAKGLQQTKNNVHSYNWINNKPKFFSTRDYLGAIHLRCSTLPCVGIPSNPPHARMCRAGCQKSETLSHILQGCPSTHWERIKRHDCISTSISKACVKKGYTILSEPHIRLSNGELRKPDLVIHNTVSNKAYIVEVSVGWETPTTLESRAQQKVLYYDKPELLDRVQTLTNTTSPPEIHTIIVGARGTWAKSNNQTLDTLGLARGLASNIILNTLRYGCTIHRSFNRLVWSKRR